MKIDKRTEFLMNSKDRIGYLYPILIDKKGEIIDGRHRLKADPNWPKRNIDADDEKALITNCHANWLRWDSQQKTTGLTSLAEYWKKSNMPYTTSKPYAEVLGLSEKTIRPLLPQKYKDEAYKRDYVETALNLSAVPNFESNVWIASGQRPTNWGDNTFHGNTPPEIINEVITVYTKNDSIILDPMAGSGTVLDACNELNRKCLAFDIKPLRKEIKFGDAEGLPQINSESVDFVFCHWPYWKMVRYSEREDDLSNLSLDGFLGKTEKVFKEMHRVLKDDKYLAVLIGNLRKNRRIYPLTAHLALLGEKYFTLYDWIVWVGTHQKSLLDQKALVQWRARKYHFYPLVCDILLIFRKVK